MAAAISSIITVRIPGPRAAISTTPTLNATLQTHALTHSLTHSYPRPDSIKKTKKMKRKRKEEKKNVYESRPRPPSSLRDAFTRDSVIPTASAILRRSVFYSLFTFFSHLEKKNGVL